MMNISDLKLYKKYKLNDLIDIFDNGAFKFGQGMVYSTKHNVLILISKHTKDRIYQDELRDGKIYYTGMGQGTNQVLTFGNKRLVDAKHDNTTVYMFLSYKTNEYSFYGRVSLDDPYYYDVEPTKDGNNRRVLKFPLTFLDAFAPMSEKELKSTITGGDVPMLNVVGACISNGDSYLLSRRSAKQGYEGKWEFPGGKVEQGEDDKDALKREIREEIGIEIDVLDELDTNTYYEKEKDRFISLKVFNAVISKGEPKAKESQTLEWKNLEDLENLDWMSADVNIVQTLIDKIPGKIVDLVDFKYKEGIQKDPKPAEIKRQCQDYEKSQKRKAKAGKDCEDAVIEYEANKLIKLGRGDLVPQIRNVGVISPDYGYDIDSFDVIDNKVCEIHIEVKSAKLVGCKIEFFISYAEYEKCKTDESYKIYALLKYGKNYRLHIVKKEEFIRDEKYLYPISYRVSIPIEEF